MEAAHERPFAHFVQHVARPKLFRVVLISFLASYMFALKDLEGNTAPS